MSLSNEQLSFAISECVRDKRKARSACSELSPEQIEKLISVFSEMRDEALEKQIKEQEELAEKQRIATEISKMADAAGISIEELELLMGKKGNPTKGAKVAPKYRLEKDGETFDWSGRGRTPKVFAEYIEQNGSLDDLAI